MLSKYNRQGASALSTSSSGGRRTSYMTLEPEKAFLTQLKPKAKRGELTTKAEIQQAFEQTIKSWLLPHPNPSEQQNWNHHKLHSGSKARITTVVDK